MSSAHHIESYACIQSELLCNSRNLACRKTLLNSAVLLPLNYRFGYEKAKYAFYLMVGLVAALMGFGVSANEDGLARNLLPQGVPPLALLGIVLIVLGLYSLSWRLSVAWYGKAEQ